MEHHQGKTNLNIGLMFVGVYETDVAPPKSVQPDEADGDKHAQLHHIAEDVGLFPVLQA